MTPPSKPPRMWFTLITRWAMFLLLLVAIVVALRPSVALWLSRATKPDTSGDPVEIRLVGVAPDGDNILFDRRGHPIPDMQLNWPGKRTLSWAPNHLQRDLLFELGPEAENLQFVQGPYGVVRDAGDRGWVNVASFGFGPERPNLSGGHPQILVRLTINEQYWKRSALFGSSQRPLEEIDFDLNFFGKQRGAAHLNFDGPFAPGQTNRPREKTAAFATVLTNKNLNLPPVTSSFRVWRPGPGNTEWQVFVYGADGKRYIPEGGGMTSTPLGWTNEFEIPGLSLTNVAAITIGEQPRVKTFHDILIKYPGRPAVTHSPILDRLATALGHTNAANVEQDSPRTVREAMTILEFLPDNRSAMSFLAHSSSFTNMGMLPAGQPEKLRKLAAAWSDQKELYNRQLGLRMGLRGGWPEFTSLALNRLTNGLPLEHIESASALAAHTNGLGQEHLPFLVDVARSNPALALAPNLVLVILRIGGPAATNALLELAPADDLVTWWSALSRLNMNLFVPIHAQTEEMQQRLWMVHASTNSAFPPGIVAAGKIRLASLLTIQLRSLNYNVFESVFSAISTRLDRRAATESMMNYLRSGTPEFWRQNHPAEIIRLLNDWYGTDMGRLGGRQKPGRTYPEYDAWPGIVEDVLDFGKKLKSDEKPSP